MAQISKGYLEDIIKTKDVLWTVVRLSMGFWGLERQNVKGATI